MEVAEHRDQILPSFPRRRFSARRVEPIQPGAGHAVSVCIGEQTRRRDCTSHFASREAQVKNGLDGSERPEAK
jgi:hypothetical protein